MRLAQIVLGVTRLPPVYALLMLSVRLLCALDQRLSHGLQVLQHVQSIDVALSLIVRHVRRMRCVGGVQLLVAALLATRLEVSMLRARTVCLVVMIHGAMVLEIVCHRWSRVLAGQAVARVRPSKDVVGVQARLRRIVRSQHLPLMRL